MEYTKKDLCKKFGISQNTVSSTLAICGLNTRKQKYSQEEIDKFTVARQMLDEGQTQKEVEEHFGIQKSPASEVDQPIFEQDEVWQEELEEVEEEIEEVEQSIDTSEFVTQNKEALANKITQILGETVVETAEAKAKEIAGLVPALVLSALNNELDSQLVIETIRTAKKKKQKQEDVPAFLLSKMQVREVKPQQPQQQTLNGKEQKQLPPGLPQNSAEES